MADSPKVRLDRIKAVEKAWEELRPAKSFAGMTLAQHQAKIAQSYSTRDELAKLEIRKTELQNARDDADVASLEATDLVVKAVVGDTDEGEDGALYEAMGFVRKSERKTGLTRKTATPATTDTPAK